MRYLYLALPVCLVCCGPGATSKMQSSLATALIATNQARDVFVAYDLDHQQKLIDDAKGDEAVATASIAAYRAKREGVTKAFVTAYTAIAVASTALAAAQTQAQGINVAALVADAISATLDVKRAIQTLTETVP